VVFLATAVGHAAPSSPGVEAIPVPGLRAAVFGRHRPKTV